MNSLIQDVRYAARILIKQPGFTLVVLMTLSLAIGANAAIFGIVNGVLLRPLPYRDADRVVMLWSRWTNWTKTWVSAPELADYRAQAASLEHVAGFSTTSFNLTSIGGDPIRVRAAQVQADLFAALGVQPLAGRVFGADEDRRGRDHVVLIGEGLWRAHFGSDPAIVNRSVQLDSTPYLVVGIMPAAVRLPIDYNTRTTTDLWVPLALGAPDPADRGNHGLNALARLRPRVTLREAQAEIETITARLRQNYPGQYDPEFGLTLTPAPVEVFGDVRPALLILLLAVGAVMLIGCANVANLLLARAEERQQELAIRTALGATRRTLVRQLLTESMVLSFTGGALGILVAFALMRALVALDPLKIPRVQELGVDGRLLIFTTCIAVVTGIVFGLVPAIHASRANPQPTLKEGGGSLRSSGWLRRGLVVAEVAATVVLMGAALLLTRSFARLLAVDPGFRAAHVLTLRTSLPSTTYRDAASMVRAYAAIGRAMRKSPGVEAAGAVTGLPLKSTRGDWGIVIEGNPATGGVGRAADWQVVTPGYFEAMGVAIRSGRTFTDADTAGTLPVIVINESMAKKFWPGQNPLGRRLTMGRNDNWLTIIGVVADVRHRGLDEPPRTEMFRPHAQFRFGDSDETVSVMTWVIRSAADPRAAAASAREAVRSVDPNLGLSDVATLEDVLSDSVSDRRLDMMLFAMLGGLALALATVGVYGVVAYSVTRRSHEIGVRMAIGARGRDVVLMVLREGLRMSIAGVAIGSIIAFWASRMIRGLLFDVSGTDPSTYAVVAAGLILIAVLACYVPARRASRLDPVRALRAE